MVECQNINPEVDGSNTVLVDLTLTAVHSNQIQNSNQINQHLFPYKHNIQIQTIGFNKTESCMEAWPIKAKLVSWDAFYKTKEGNKEGN